MRLTTLLLADHASVDSSGKLYVNGAGITRIEAPLPSALPFLSVLAHFIVEAEDDVRRRASEVQIRVTGPAGQEIAVLPPQVVGPLEQKGETYEDQTVTLVANIGGLPLVAPGRYRFDLLVDGSVAGELAVAVVAATAKRPLPPPDRSR